MNNFSRLLTNVNRTSIFPLRLTLEEAILLFNSKRPFNSRKNCHGHILFKILVARECIRLGENNRMIIAGVASHLWKGSTSLEKSEYTDLAQRYGTNNACVKKGESLCTEAFFRPEKSGEWKSIFS
ncbi:hypothetical protein Glove_33g177 [Diversispora epigaea]|uniref:HMG box domain-containing protein n=1 Tax=Diversispora epigaea TaxID=1348612 RepID=A0A397JLI3_9GLOM|nr:hypothetical protein Glove_33g177 [Diversispora epigaea]